MKEYFIFNLFYSLSIILGGALNAPPPPQVLSQPCKPNLNQTLQQVTCIYLQNIFIQSFRKFKYLDYLTFHTTAIVNYYLEDKGY